MNTSQISDSRVNGIVSAPSPSGTGRKAIQVQPASECGRKAILYGWLISMIGIVTYCFVMSNGDQQAGLLDALNAQGAAGWGAVLIIFGGVTLWFVGCIRHLNAIDSSSDGPGDC